MFEDRAAHESEARLSALFSAYRAACPDPDPAADFMPRLWEKIESRQSFAKNLKRLSQAFITAAALVTILMGVAMTQTDPHASPFYANTYIEMLAADQGTEGIADAEIIDATQEQNR